MARYQGNRLGAQDRSSLFLTILFGRTVITLQTISCDPWPPGKLGADRLHYRRECIFVAHGKHYHVQTFLRDKFISLLCGNIFLRVLLGRPEPGLPPCSSRNSSRWYGPLLSLISPPRPRFCSSDLQTPAGAPSEEDNLLHATKANLMGLTFQNS